MPGQVFPVSCNTNDVHHPRIALGRRCDPRCRSGRVCGCGLAMSPSPHLLALVVALPPCPDRMGTPPCGFDHSSHLFVLKPTPPLLPTPDRNFAYVAVVGALVRCAGLSTTNPHPKVAAPRPSLLPGLACPHSWVPAQWMRALVALFCSIVGLWAGRRCDMGRSAPFQTRITPYVTLFWPLLASPSLHGNEATGLSHSPVGHWTQIIAASEPPLMSPLPISSIEEEEKY